MKNFAMSILKASLLSVMVSIFITLGLCFGGDIRGHFSGTELRNTTEHDSSDTVTKLHEALDALEKRLGELEKDFESLSEDFKSIPESEEFKKLEKELDRLREDLIEGGNTARKKIEKEVIPQLKKEIERLKEKYLKRKKKKETRTIEI